MVHYYIRIRLLFCGKLLFRTLDMLKTDEVLEEKKMKKYKGEILSSRKGRKEEREREEGKYRSGS